MKKHHPIFSVVRRDNDAVKNALQEALLESRDRDVDGIIIILARNNGRDTSHYLAGSLRNPEKAGFESFVLQLAQGIGKANR